jgi:hypothetical protein
MPYIYLIHTRASLNIKEPVYKIGKTADFSKRISGYDKGSEPILMLYVNNCDIFEKRIIEIFNTNFIKRSDYGNEYFEGNVSDMIGIIMDNFKELNMCYNIEQEQTKQVETNVTNNQELFIKKRNLLQKLLNKICEKNINKFSNDFMQVTNNSHNHECVNMRCNIQNAISNYNANIMNFKQNPNIIFYKKFGDYLQNRSNVLFEITHNHLNSNNNDAKNFYNVFKSIV